MPALQATVRWVVLWLAIAPVLACPAANGQSVSLGADHQEGDGSRVTLTLDIGGKLRQTVQPAGKQGKTKEDKTLETAEYPLRVAGRLMYDEILASRAPGSDYATVSARYYHRAEAAIEVGGQSERIRLRDDRRSIVSDATDGPVLYSSAGPLTREELDLIEVPGNSLLVDRLLPSRSMQVGDRWSNQVDTIAGMLKWTELTEGEITSQLEEIRDGLALVSITGKAKGSAEGAVSEARIRGEYRYDVNWHRVSWLLLSIEETRQSGPIHPGFEVTAKLRMRMEPLSASPQIAATMLKSASLPRTDASLLLSLEPRNAAFSLTHDRRWYVTGDIPRRTILRCLDNGEVLAQLSVMELAKLPAGKEVSLEGFQADIQDALGDRFREFVSVQQDRSGEDYRILRVVTAGVVAEIPMRWIYYHVNDSAGRRAAHVYSAEADKLDQLATTDQEMVSGFRFRTASSSNPVAARKASRHAGESR